MIILNNSVTRKCNMDKVINAIHPDDPEVIIQLTTDEDGFVKMIKRIEPEAKNE
jgi:hypothetical protein